MVHKLYAFVSKVFDIRIYFGLHNMRCSDLTKPKNSCQYICIDVKVISIAVLLYLVGMFLLVVQ
jgi:hypothetical protein